MPKGQYDRKAAAAKRAAKNGKTAGAAEAPRVKRKYTKRAGVPAVGDAGMGLTAIGQGQIKGAVSDLYELEKLVGLLTGICQLKSAGHNIVDPLIKKTMKTLESRFDSIFTTEESPTIGNGHVEKTVSALPTPEKFIIPPPPPPAAS